MTPGRVRLTFTAREAGLAVLLTLLVSSFAAMAGTGTAAAHAGLAGTEPMDGQVVDTFPDQVTMRFTEPVQVRDDAIAVYADDLTSVHRGPAGHVTGEPAVVGVSLEPGLAEGTYTVTWRVTSADGHPVDGSFRFSVGRPSAAAEPPQVDDSAAVAMLQPVARGAGYLGVVLALGVPLVIRTLWPAGRADRWLGRAVWFGVVALPAGALAELLLAGPASVGSGVGAVADAALLGETLGTGGGRALLARLVLTAGIGVWALRTVPAADSAPRAGRGAAGVWFGGVLLIATAATMAVTGHTGTGPWIGWSVAADSAHTAAMAVWFGGLVMFAVAGATSAVPADAITTSAATAPATSVPLASLTRFSRWASVCVAVLVVTGLFQTWRTVRFLPALVDTAYGRLLLIKVAVVAVVVLLGAMARRWIRRATAADPGRHASTAVLRRALAGELVLGTAVIALTAVLTGTASAREAYRPVAVEHVQAGPHELETVLDPARTGTATMTVRLHDDVGAAVPLLAVEGSMRLADRDLGPLPVELAVHDDGTAAGGTVPLPAAGLWEFDLIVQTSPTAATSYRVAVDVR